MTLPEIGNYGTGQAKKKEQRPMRYPGYDYIGFRTIHSHIPGFWPAVGESVEVPAATEHTSPCPRFKGDGCCVALTVRGAQSAGYRLRDLILVGWQAADELARDGHKVRVRRASVLADIPLADFLASGANLDGADLRGARGLDR